MTTPQWYCDLLDRANVEATAELANDCDDIIDYDTQHRGWYNDLISKANVEIDNVNVNVENANDVDDDIIDYNAQQNFGWSNRTSEVESYENQT